MWQQRLGHPDRGLQIMQVWKEKKVCVFTEVKFTICNLCFLKKTHSGSLWISFSPIIEFSPHSVSIVFPKPLKSRQQERLSSHYKCEINCPLSVFVLLVTIHRWPQSCQSHIVICSFYILFKQFSCHCLWSVERKNAVMPILEMKNLSLVSLSNLAENAS